jgi:hypothetical protein
MRGTMEKMWYIQTVWLMRVIEGGCRYEGAVGFAFGVKYILYGIDRRPVARVLDSAFCPMSSYTFSILFLSRALMPLQHAHPPCTTLCTSLFTLLLQILVQLPKAFQILLPALLRVLHSERQHATKVFILNESRPAWCCFRSMEFEDMCAGEDTWKTSLPPKS